MKLKSTLKKLGAVAAGLAVSSIALANNGVDSGDAFYSFYSTIDGWISGALGTGLALTMLLMGGGIGVAKNSPMPALTGVAGAAFLHWGPQIIKNLMGGGALF